MQTMTENIEMPFNSLDVFHFDESRPNFESLARGEGAARWNARDLMGMLGYQSFDAFNKVVQRAISTCATLGVDITENFQPYSREVDGKDCRDYRLSRFACYLIAMNGDTKKVEVARAQIYFATLAESFQRYVEQAEEVERVLVRDEISDHEKALSAIAKKAGVGGAGYAFFQNAGYRGMYNMNLSQLRVLKRVPNGRSPLDFMGKTELAANLFRITQTEEKIRQERIMGQSAAEVAAETVGRTVRRTMREISGVLPESLPRADDIKDVRGALKQSAKEFARLDKPKRA